MNSLITLGTVTAYGYSLLVTIAPALLPANLRDVYFEAVGVIVTLIMLGRLLEARAKAGNRRSHPGAARTAGPRRPSRAGRGRNRDPRRRGRGRR